MFWAAKEDQEEEAPCAAILPPQLDLGAHPADAVILFPAMQAAVFHDIPFGGRIAASVPPEKDDIREAAAFLIRIPTGTLQICVCAPSKKRRAKNGFSVQVISGVCPRSLTLTILYTQPYLRCQEDRTMASYVAVALAAIRPVIKVRNCDPYA